MSTLSPESNRVYLDTSTLSVELYPKVRKDHDVDVICLRLTETSPPYCNLLYQLNGRSTPVESLSLSYLSKVGGYKGSLISLLTEVGFPLDTNRMML